MPNSDQPILDSASEKLTGFARKLHPMAVLIAGAAVLLAVAALFSSIVQYRDAQISLAAAVSETIYNWLFALALVAFAAIIEFLSRIWRQLQTNNQKDKA